MWADGSSFRYRLNTFKHNFLSFKNDKLLNLIVAIKPLMQNLFGQCCYLFHYTVCQIPLNSWSEAKVLLRVPSFMGLLRFSVATSLKSWKAALLHLFLLTSKPKQFHQGITTQSKISGFVRFVGSNARDSSKTEVILDEHNWTQSLFGCTLCSDFQINLVAKPSRLF